MFPYIIIDTLALPTYGVMVACGLLISGLFAFVRVKKAGLSVDDFLIISACALGLGLVGAGLSYIFVSFSIGEIITLIRAGQMDALLHGGMIFYGGLIGAFLVHSSARVWLRQTWSIF